MTRSVTGFLLGCGALGSVLFMFVIAIESFARPGYSSWHHFVSSLSLGERGWVQVANFVVCGLFMLCFASGLRLATRHGRGAVAAPVAVALFGGSLIAAGAFSTEPNLGYPPGVASSWPVPQTLHGALHGVAFLAVCVSLITANIVLGRRFAVTDSAARGWVVYSIITAALCFLLAIACQLLSVMDAKGTLSNAPVGLCNRILIAVEWFWVAIVAVRFLREERHTRAG